MRRAFFVDLHHEFAQECGELAGPEEIFVSSGAPTKILLIPGKGLIEKDSSRRNQGFDPGKEWAMQIAEDQHGSETRWLERG